MRELLTWSLNLGRWGGVQVRLHAFFLVLAAYILHVSASEFDGKLLWYGVASLAILCVSVALHEVGHCLAARRAGGSCDHMLVWPFGGLTAASVPADPLAELATALAGPAMNFLISCLIAPVLLMQGEPLGRLLNPFVPPYDPAFETLGFTWLGLLELAFWINWLLVAVNLLPAFPLDGARVVRALLWYVFGSFRLASVCVARAAQVAAVGMWVLAWLVHDQYAFASMPLVVLGVIMFFAARCEADRGHRDAQSDEWAFGYDFSQGYTSLERNAMPPAPRAGPLRQWIDRRRAERRRRQRETEQADERRVDDILARLHETGMEGLNPEDQALLKRVSERYRNRTQR
jgi:stage IV sporulation protein FB